MKQDIFCIKCGKKVAEVEIEGTAPKPNEFFSMICGDTSCRSDFIIEQNNKKEIADQKVAVAEKIMTELTLEDIVILKMVIAKFKEQNNIK